MKVKYQGGERTTDVTGALCGLRVETLTLDAFDIDTLFKMEPGCLKKVLENWYFRTGWDSLESGQG